MLFIFARRENHLSDRGGSEPRYGRRLSGITSQCRWCLISVERWVVVCLNAKKRHYRGEDIQSKGAVWIEIQNPKHYGQLGISTNNQMIELEVDRGQIIVSLQWTIKVDVILEATGYWANLSHHSIIRFVSWEDPWASVYRIGWKNMELDLEQVVKRLLLCPWERTWQPELMAGGKLRNQYNIAVH